MNETMQAGSIEETTGFDYPVGHRLVDGNPKTRGIDPPASFAPLEVFQDEHHQSYHERDNDNTAANHHHHIGSARTPWYGTTIVLLSEVMGTGVLSLPFAARTLGWAWTVLAVPLFAIVAAYSGWLLARVKFEFKAFGSYADATDTLLGPRLGQFTKICMLVNWGATAIYYLIALSDGIGDLLYGKLSCDYQRSLIAIMILVLPCQCRDFYNISKFLSAPSTMAILVLLAIVMIRLLQDNDLHESENNNDKLPFGYSTTFGPLPDTNLFDFLQAMSAFVFAYQGQSIYLELMSEMKDARQFPRACNLAYTFMSFIYGFTILVAYGMKGIDTPEFLPDSVPAGVARRIAGALVVLHITVSYVIACQPLHNWLHCTIFPQTYQEESTLGSIHWFLLTVGYLMIGFVIGNLIPFFADVQALIGSLFGAPIVFGWPAAFYLALHRRNTHSWSEAATCMGYGNLIICSIFLFVCTPLFCLLGTTGAIQSIIQDSKEAVKPFQCY